MADFLLTRRAERDQSIVDYTLEQFDIEQTHKYREELRRLFQLLACNPRMGRDCSHIRAHLRRHDHAAHSVYYRITPTGVLIRRVLGSAQDPIRHF